ncbi:GIY-YIG nuclease family protein [Arcanobacterium ihumii]|uniref:GIY-YIG nuclease family protein n=1 Tax=Arcanobacterium ihumii TaxID=2138162 RepID=UPI000F536ED4|nr:GIY-YIG nuclease family protein [Arcanobacterium ihumii]
MPTPKTIELFLLDGTAAGRKKASLSNWTGVVFLLPRTTIETSRDRDDLRQTGVYFLFGTDDSDETKVYIGQACERKNGQGVLARIIEHREEKLDYWTHAIALITSNDSFGPTEISYLEHRFTQMARDAGRYDVANGNDPSIGKVTEEKRAELDEFITNAKLLIGVLGYRVFDPFNEARSVTPENPRELTDAKATATVEPLLYLTWGSAQATGRQTSDGFAVLAGSKLRPESEFTNTAPGSALKQRERYRDAIDSSTSTLVKDVLLASPSGAAAFVVGASVSGMAAWKTEDGVTLAELERRGE